MAEKKKNWQQTISRLSLTISLALFIFGIVSSIFSLAVSIMINAIGRKQWFLEQPNWLILTFVAIGTFVLMTISLFYSEFWINKRIDELEDSVGEKLLSLLSIFLALILLTICYFGFSTYLTFLHNNFWA